MQQLGKHDFDGSCAPGNPGGCSWESFSLGIFEWISTSNGLGLKRGKVKVRVKGSTAYPDRVEAKAREVADALDAGRYTGPKTVAA